MKFLVLILVFVFLAGCAASGYQQFYNPYVDAKTLPDIELLKENQKPQVFGTDNFDRDIQILRSKNYIVLGYSSFNGGYEDTDNAVAQAKRIGATIIIVSSQYTNTQTTTSTLFLPDNKTTYNSGTAHSNTSYNSTGGYIGSSNTNTTYNGTSTTYSTKAVPVTTSQNRYDQTAVYFVKSTHKYKFGLHYNDLTPEQRTHLERNTGVFINLVIEDAPAFYANVLVGDILIAVDGQSVKNTQHATELLTKVANSEKTSSKLTVIRNGLEKIIKVQF